MSLDLNKVSAKFQLYWPANNRIIAGLCFLIFRVLPLQKSRGCHKLVAGQPRDCMQELQAGGKQNFVYRLVASLPSVSTV